MSTLRDDAMKLIANLPNDVAIDEVMYKLYVIDKVRRGEEAVKDGHILSSVEVQQEINQW